jgi:hypothetical protein
VIGDLTRDDIDTRAPVSPVCAAYAGSVGSHLPLVTPDERFESDFDEACAPLRTHTKVSSTPSSDGFEVARLM